jgi:Protein of unknown function (DUF4242)
MSLAAASLELTGIMRQDRHHGKPAGRQTVQPFQRRGMTMPLFLIERNFAQEVMLDNSDLQNIRQINDEVGIQWLFSFLSVDRRKTYCLYEAPNAEAIRLAARRLDIPADVIIAVGTIPISDFRAEQYAMAQATGP